MKINKILKVIAATSAVAMLSVSMFAGCGKKADESSGNSGQTTIKFCMWGSMNEKYNFIKSFEEKNPDIKVDLMIIPEDSYSEKINSMIAGNSAPDVILSWECDINRFAKNGAIVQLDDYMEESGLDVGGLIPAVQDMTKMNNGTYGLPWSYASEILYYNKDLFDAAGVEYPNDEWTWEDFRDAANKLTIRDGDNVTQWGANSIDFPGIWYSQMGQAGDEIVTSDGVLSLGDGAKKALQFEYDLINVDKVVPAPSATSGNGIDLFTSGKAAMNRGGSWLIKTYAEIKDFNWDIAVLPKDKQSYSSLHTGFFSISNSSKNKDAAWKFINYCMGEEGQEMISKATNNPSCVKEYMAQGHYKYEGQNGPTNWEVIDKTAEFAKFGYVLTPPGLTNKLVDKFNSAAAGQVDIDTALKESQKELDTVSNQ